ncbi:MAG: putative negative regulator of RcsB-dependent stress response [Oleispira sp.]|jgi:predicted negative regulator of RcsB-dependent stress response
MSEEMRTEEEQVEAIKNWWNENGKSLLVTIAVVLSGYFGWNAYQDHQRTQGEAASSIYQKMVSKATKPLAEQTEADKIELEVVAAQLKAEYPGTLYAQFSSLYLAKFAIEANDFEGAAAELQALVDAGDKNPVTYLAQVRLARVFIQLEKLDEALALVDTTPEASFAAQYEETKGDVLFAKGDLAAALVSYQTARISATALGIDTQLISRKIDDLAGANIAATDA